VPGLPQRHAKGGAQGKKRVSFTSRFKHGKLRKGAVIEVRVTASDKIGLVKRYTMRPPAFPRELSPCLAPGTKTPAPC
jgi:hypothetical protein